jgi:hypothetical protein
VYLVESGNLSPDVLSLAEGVVVSVVGIPDIIVVVVKAFECSRGDTSGNIKGFLDVLWGISPLLIESDCRSDGHVATGPAGVVAGAAYEIGSTRRTVVRGDGFASGNVYRAATFYALIRDDGRAVRTDAEVVSRELAQRFELFIEEILIDDCLAVLARFHSDTWYTL